MLILKRNKKTTQSTTTNLRDCEHKSFPKEAADI